MCFYNYKKMRLYILIFLQLQVTLFCNCVGYEHRGTHDVKNKPKHHHQTKSKVVMPSGNSYLIATPSVPYKPKCPGDRAKLITMHPKSWAWKKEYNIVKKELENTKGNAITYKYVKIQKVINPCLWMKYKYRKGQVYSEAKKSTERMLFYAAAHPITIVEKGFDERYTKLSNAYGAGFIFTDNSFKTNASAKTIKDGHKVMLMCRVALGNMYNVTTPQQLPHAPVGFQSVTGADGGFKQFVIYRGEQAYPEYVITYKT